MKTARSAIFAGLLLLASIGIACAQQNESQGTKEEARAMIEKAETWFKQYGKDTTLAEITRAGTEKTGAFIDRDLYIFAYNFDGITQAHGSNPKLIGKNLFDIQDADGRYLIRGLIDKARKGRGWYYYKWANPISRKIEDKMAYVVKIDDKLWIGCGVYGEKVREDPEIRIGVFTFFAEARYSEALAGIKAQLEEEGFSGPEVKYTVKNANGSYIKADELIREFSDERIDLIVSLGTVATIALTKQITGVPVVFSVVYDPVESDIAEGWHSSGNNTTGTSTKIPMSKLLNRLKEFTPVNKLAVLYTPGQKNSEHQLRELEKVQSVSKIKIVPVPLSRKEEVKEILPEVVHTTDGIYLTGSSIVGSTTSTIVAMANQEKLPTITHLKDLVDKGALIGMCVDSYLAGRLAGEKAAQVLNGSNPSSIPIASPGAFDLILNQKTATAGHFEVPPSFMKQVTKMVQ